MTYEEAIKKAGEKLGDWGLFFDSAGWIYSKPNSNLSLEVNNPESGWYCDGLLSISLWAPLNVERTSAVTKLENLFADPFNATEEEVEVFKLEYGFNYPKELTSSELCD